MSNFSSTYPSVSPTYQIDFANGKRIPPNATFTRASTANVFDGKHLSSENLLLDSKTGTANWTGDSSGAALVPVVTANHAASPDGTASQATRVQLDLNGNTSSSDYARYYQAHNVASGTSTTFAVWMKSTDGTSSYAAQILSPAGPGVAVTITGSWQKFTVTANSFGNITYGVRLRGGQTPTNADTADILIWGANLSTTGQTVLSETTTQIHREYAPSLVSKANNAARFETATDGQSMGCLIEGQSTNLATYGSDLTNAAWNPLSAFIGGTAVGPDGTLSAVKLVASAGSGLAPRFRRLSLLTDTTQTFSIYVKPLEFQHLAISADGSTSCMVLYNLSGSGAITSATGATGTVEQCGNGWFRVSYSYTTTPSLHLAITMQSSTTYQTETGNGYDGMLFALAMLENSSHASSFIGTTSSTVTRAADSMSVVSADLFDNGGGSLVVETENVGRAYYAAVLEDDSTSVYQDYVALTVRADNKARQTVNAPGSTGASDEFSAASTVGGSYFKIASRFAPNDFGVCIDGGAVSTDTAGAVPSNVDKLFIGWYDDGGRANAHIKRIAVYNEALSDTNLQAITS
jgi:hypothetical protein